MTADTMPGTMRPASTSIAERVTAQLHRDYPPNSLGWVAGVSWSGPTRVPLSQIDRKAGDWSAAADKRKVSEFKKRIGAGWAKPVIAVRRPGTRLMYLVDGHTRATACAELGVPVTAYVGTAATAHGGWEQTHSHQLASEAGAVDLSARTPVLAVTPAPAGKPGGPGLWRVRGMSLPPYFENVRDALERAGHPPADAYRLTWGAIRRWARGGGKAHPEVVAAAQAALADLAAKSARAHAHASEGPALELAGAFNSAAHPRVAKGHGNAGQFGSQGTAVKAAPAAAGYKPAASGAKARSSRPAAAAAPPGGSGRARQLHRQARKDRHLAHVIMSKASALVRVRDGYIAGVLTSTGRSTVATKAVSAKRSAAAKKAAATLKAEGGRKKKAKSSTKSAAATKASNIRRLNGEIRVLRHDAKALLKSADRLDALAGSL